MVTIILIIFVLWLISLFIPATTAPIVGQVIKGLIALVLVLALLQLLGLIHVFPMRAGRLC